MAKKNPILAALQKAAKGLRYTSETDAPLEAFAWDDGAVLQQFISELEIECLVTDIPNEIVQVVTEMEKDSELHISDLKLPPGVRSLQEGDLALAHRLGLGAR